jgi:hypothetical protein
MKYSELSKEVESLDYRDKFRLAQLLIQLARKEEEDQNPKQHPISSTEINIGSELTEYVAERIKKLRHSKKEALLNSISAIFQFRGGISEDDREKVVANLKRKRYIQLDEKNNRVSYPD